jgi:hypothetical protein
MLSPREAWNWAMRDSLLCAYWRVAVLGSCQGIKVEKSSQPDLYWHDKITIGGSHYSKSSFGNCWRVLKGLHAQASLNPFADPILDYIYEKSPPAQEPL